MLILAGTTIDSSQRKQINTVACSDIATDIEAETIQLLKPCNAAKLRIGDRVTKVILKAPKVHSKVDPDKIFEVFRKQIKSLKTEDWKLIGSNKTENHQTIDETFLADLKAADMKAYLGFGKVYFTIFQKKDELLENGFEDNPV